MKHQKSDWQTARSIFALLTGLGLVAANGQPASTNCTPPPAGLVSWWRGEGNPLDSFGANNGVASNFTYVAGEVGEGFLFDGLHSDLFVPASTSLDVGQGPGMTIEVWINPADMVSHPIFDWSPNHAYGVHFWESHPVTGALYADLVDTQGTDHMIQSDPGVIVSGSFQHVAVTYDKASGIARLFLDGAVIVTSNLGTFTPRTSTDLQIGYRLPDAPFGEHSFNGIIDEPSLYSRALDPAEIAAIYAAGSAGKCLGPPPVVGSASVKALENEMIQIPSYRFLDYCSAPDGAALNLTAVSSSTANGGSASLSAGGVAYLPPPNYLGSDLFQFTVTSVHGGTASGQMMVWVEPRLTAAAAMLQPIASTGGMQIRFSGFPERAYLIQRAASVLGPWVAIGTASTDLSGTAVFLDPEPPATSAYYRAAYP